MLTGISYLIVCRIDEPEGVNAGNCLKIRHFGLRKSFPYRRVHKQDLCLGMVHKMVNVARFEFVKKRNRNRSVGHGCKERHSPVHLVASADCHFVSLFQAAMLEQNVNFCDSFCQIAVENGGSLVV